jgi:hypothetical protein
MDLQPVSLSEMQPVSLPEMEVVEGGQHHKNDDLNLVAPYNRGGGGFSSGSPPNFVE